MRKEGLDEIVLNKLKLPKDSEPDIESWKHFLGKLKNPTTEVNIGLIGKYVELPDAYKSIVEALTHAGAVNECKVKIHWIQSEKLIDVDSIDHLLNNLHGILVAPGFGDRGIEGKVMASKYAREQQVPFFGICLGLQCAVIDFARHVAQLEGAHSTEMQPDTPHPVIHKMEDQKNLEMMGGTMRLGAYPCKLKKSSITHRLYGHLTISERHRHRFEFNNQYLELFEKAGFQAVGVNPETELVEVMELKSHPFFLGSQFHPELKSTVENPHPLFVGFIEAAMQRKKMQ